MASTIPLDRSIDAQISEARQKAQKYSDSLRLAKELEAEKRRWMQSYEKKTVLVHQLEKELTATVELLDHHRRTGTLADSYVHSMPQYVPPPAVVPEHTFHEHLRNIAASTSLSRSEEDMLRMSQSGPFPTVNSSVSPAASTQLNHTFQPTTTTQDSSATPQPTFQQPQQQAWEREREEMKNEMRALREEAEQLAYARDTLQAQMQFRLNQLREQDTEKIQMLNTISTLQTRVQVLETEQSAASATLKQNEQTIQLLRMRVHELRGEAEQVRTLQSLVHSLQIRLKEQVTRTGGLGLGVASGVHGSFPSSTQNVSSDAAVDPLLADGEEALSDLSPPPPSMALPMPPSSIPPASSPLPSPTVNVPTSLARTTASTSLPTPAISATIPIAPPLVTVPPPLSTASTPAPASTFKPSSPKSPVATSPSRAQHHAIPSFASAALQPTQQPQASNLADTAVATPSAASIPPPISTPMPTSTSVTSVPPPVVIPPAPAPASIPSSPRKSTTPKAKPAATTVATMTSPGHHQPASAPPLLTASVSSSSSASSTSSAQAGEALEVVHPLMPVGLPLPTTGPGKKKSAKKSKKKVSLPSASPAAAPSPAVQRSVSVERRSIGAEKIDRKANGTSSPSPITDKAGRRTLQVVLPQARGVGSSSNGNTPNKSKVNKQKKAAQDMDRSLASLSTTPSMSRFGGHGSTPVLAPRPRPLASPSPMKRGAVVTPPSTSRSHVFHQTKTPPTKPNVPSSLLKPTAASSSRFS